MKLFDRGDGARLARDYERLLAMAGRLSGVGYWRYDAVSGDVMWSRQVYRIHGLDPASFDPNFDQAIAFYPPEDRRVVTSLLRQALADGAGYEFQVRLQRADGQLRHVACKADCERAPDGSVGAVFGVFQDVTEHVLALETAQAARREAEDEARRAAVAEEIAGLGHWRVDFPARRLSWSPQMHVIYGLPPANELTVDEVMAMTHPEDRALTEARLDADLRGEAGERPVIRIIRPDGALRWVLGHTRVERNGDGEVVALLGTLMDVTRQQEAERLIAESEARHRLLTENANDVVTQMNADGVLTYVSPAVVSLTGFTPEEMVGRRAVEFIAPEDRRRVAEAFDAATGRARSWRVEYRVPRKDGRTIWVEARPSFSASPNGDGSIFVTDVVRDISERKQMEAELIAARSVAEAATAVKSEFLANMSHELRTPLTSILGFSDLLRPWASGDDEAARYLESVAAASRVLLTTVNDILDFSRLEVGQVDIEARPASLDATFAAAVELLRPQAEPKQLRLIFERADELPPWVALDETRVRQVLLNLLSNAVKFTFAGEIRVGLRPAQGAGRMRCEVRDSGAGIAPDRLAGLFKRFSQVDGSTRRLHGGTGLGLAICKGLVEAMGGQIGVESRLGAGSVFWFEIPLVPASGEAAEAAAHDGAAAGLEGVRLLVVDDKPGNLELVRRLLESVDVEVTEAASGEEAVSLARSWPFDVILMDLRMPGLDGCASASAIRAGAGPNSRTPILAFSAELDLGDSAGAQASVFDGQVLKPLVSADLLRAIQTVVACEAQPEHRRHA
jgi:PAS domain S-box-containing protein